MTKNNRLYYSLISVMLTVCMLLHVVYPMIASAADNKIYVEDIKIYE